MHKKSAYCEILMPEHFANLVISLVHYYTFSAITEVISNSQRRKAFVLEAKIRNVCACGLSMVIMQWNKENWFADEQSILILVN